jgi:hypothetical protein
MTREALERLKRYQIRVLGGVLVLLAALCIPFLIAGRSPVCFGLLVGSAASLLGFRLRVLNSLRLACTDPKRSKRLAFTGSLFRFLLYGLALAAAVKCEHVSLAGTVCGLFLLQPVLILEALLNRDGAPGVSMDSRVGSDGA